MPGCNFFQTLKNYSCIYEKRMLNQGRILKGLSRKKNSPMNKAKFFDTFTDLLLNAKTCNFEEWLLKRFGIAQYFHFPPNCVTSWVISDCFSWRSFWGWRIKKFGSNGQHWQNFLKDPFFKKKNRKFYSI